MASNDWQAQPERSYEYLIRVQGRISPKWASWFEDMSLSVETLGDHVTITTLRGKVIDQAALQGLLQKLYNLGFALTEVRRTEKCDIDDRGSHNQDR